MTKTFHTLPGTHSEGDDYEEVTIANLILKMVNDDSFTNFTMSSNDRAFVPFDDIVLQTFGKKSNYALQLKHSKNGTTLSISSLTSESGDFSIKKYFERYKENENLSSCKLILFTNRSFDGKGGQEIHFPHQGFTVRLSKVKSDPLLSTRDCYQFIRIKEQETDAYDEFFQNFYLYPNQVNHSRLRRNLEGRFVEQFDCGGTEFEHYCKFISQWHKTTGMNEKLEKEVMNRVIALSVLTQFTRPLIFGDVSHKMELLRAAIDNFDVAIFNEESYANVAKLWGDEKDHLLEEIEEVREIWNRYKLGSNGVDLSDVNCSKILWLKGKCPLIVTEDKTTLEAIRLCKSQKFVLIGQTLEGLEDCNVFRNLSDLDPASEAYRNIASTFTCSIQGKEEVSLDSLIDDSSDVIRTSDLIDMLEVCQIGGGKEPLPKPHIERRLTQSTIRLDYLNKIDKNTLVIVDNYRNLPISDTLKAFNVIPITDYDSDRYETRAKELESYLSIEKDDQVNDLVESNLGLDLYVSELELSNQEFENICEENGIKECYHFRLTPDGNLEWIQSLTTDLDTLRDFFNETTAIEERVMFEKSQDKINLIIGEPGMGKSVLMRNLKNGSKPTFWSVIFFTDDIGSLTKFFKNKDISISKFEEFVLTQKYPNLRSLERRVLARLMKECRVVYIWDALDEISSRNLEILSVVILELSKKNVSQWITCRSHLKDYLEKRFNTFARKILQFTEEQQRYYINERLFASRREDTEMIRRLIIHHDILGIPLQIFMLTQLFLADASEYRAKLSGSAFNAIDLYNFFIEEKFKIYYKKHIGDYRESLKIFQDSKNTRIGNYQRAALKALVPKLFTTSQEFEKFFTEMQKVNDPYGIVAEITDQNVPQFIHKSFAEYFVALYFQTNHSSIENFEDIIFEENNRNIRFFFDLLLAQNSPPHVAILYKNVERLQEHAIDVATSRDSGGRNLLHLACSWGQKYPTFNKEHVNGTYIIDNTKEGEFAVSKEDVEYAQMLDYLLERCDLSETDDLFKFTPESYAEKTDSLYAKIAVLRRQNRLQLDNSVVTFYYYSAKFGYDNILDPCPFIKTKSDGGTLLHHAVCHLDFVQMLLQVDAYRENSSAPDDYGQTALLKACQKNSDAVVLTLIQNGDSVNTASNIGRTPLHYACQYGHENIVRLLIDQGSNVNAEDAKKWTPLHVAAYNGHTDSVRFLIGANANIEACDLEKRTPLHIACVNGHEDVVQVLIDSRADVNAGEGTNWRPLHSACFSGHEEVVKLLVRNEVDINSLTKNGRTALHYACEKGFTDIVKFLCDNGADVDISDNKEWTPLHLASKNGHDRIAGILTDAGADVNIARNKEWTPIILACWKGYDKVLKYLVTTSADANLATIRGRTPLHYACHFGHYEATKYLLDFSDIDVKDSRGLTELHHCASKGYVKVVYLLLQKGAFKNATSNQGKTPLHYACQHGHVSTVQLLLKFEVDTNIADRGGMTALHYACINGNPGVISLLTRTPGINLNAKNERGWTPLHYASQNGHLQAVGLLLEKNPEIDPRTNDGGTPLYLASLNGHDQVVRSLGEAGASVNATTPSGWSPLRIACENNHFRVVWQLTYLNANPNIADDEGITPLHAACEKKNPQIVRHLLNAGASVRVASSIGWSPLHVTCARGGVDICRMLLQYQDDVDIVDNDDRTPLYIACQEGQESILKLLLSRNANVNTASRNGWTPLHAACDSGQVTVIPLLLKYIDVNITDIYQQTPLFYACQSGHLETVNLLVENRANVNHPASNNVTPLHIATKNNHGAVVPLLIEAGARVDALDVDDNTALHYASDAGFSTIVRILLGKGASTRVSNKVGLNPRQVAYHKGHTNVVAVFDEYEDNRPSCVKRVLLCKWHRQTSLVEESHI